MAPVETIATILSTFPYGETSKVARLATRELGVVSVIANTPKYGPDFTNWDDHPGNAMRPGHFADYMKRRLPYFDQSVAALIDDIFDRGLDRKVLLVVVGEFGRTPKMRYGDSLILDNSQLYKQKN